MLDILFAFLFFLCWGSFLNVVGYRLVRDQSLQGRSRCPSCATKLAWYDLIPVLSWITLKGKCRTCKAPISFLYPLIELLTAISCTSLIFVDPLYRMGCFIFFSALIVTVRTDLEKMLISRSMTLYLIPVAFFLSFENMLPVSPIDSMIGAIFGYAILWIIAWAFKKVRKIEGLGQGDLDLLAMIGAFTGFFGAWFALVIGSLLGSCIGLIVALKTKRHDVALPFGPWLAIGAIAFVFLQKYITTIFLNQDVLTTLSI